jgi:hypothetical protein
MIKTRHLNETDKHLGTLLARMKTGSNNFESFQLFR